VNTSASHIVADAVTTGDTDRPALSCRLGGERLLCLMGPRPCRRDYMRLLAGVDVVGGGELELLGWASGNLDCETSRWLRRRVGYIAPYLRLLSVISAWRNVLLGVNYHDIGSAATREERARALLDAMPGAADPATLPAHMSQLQHMHASAARSLMLEPAFLFAEDPFRGLERDERQHLGEFLAGTARFYAGTIVVSTDDAGFACDYAERILFVSPNGHFDFSDWATLRSSRQSAVQAYLRQRSGGEGGPEEEQ